MTTEMEVPENLWQINTSFSQKVPGLQVAMDSTSLGELKTCPRKYYYTLILGSVRREESAHLTFGILLHEALELYDRQKLAGQTHDQATCAALKHVLVKTWNFELKRPWISDEPTKNRETLARTVVWYLEQFADDPAETIILNDGKPAIELSFRMELGYGPRSGGDDYYLCGHLDRVVKFEGETWVTDRKTTKYTLSDDYFQKYSPDNQMSIYTLAGHLVFKQKVSGLIIDAAQVGVTFSRFRRGIVTRTPAQLNEWLVDLRWWLRQAELYAENQYWPHNDKSCTMYGGCPFVKICATTPELRKQKLDAMFSKRVWDPLKTREI